MKASFVAVITTLIAISLATDCSRKIDRSRASTNKYTVTYDLSPLVSNGQWVLEEADLVARNFTYHFNLCKGVKVPPTYGSDKSSCKNRTQEGDLYPAYQVGGNGGCYHLGAGVDEEHMKWEPIDYDDPSTGVVVQYTGGDDFYCQGKQRSLRLSFFCVNYLGALPNSATVVEYPQCTYNIHLNSQFACPISCGEYNRELCGGNGVCGFDRDKQKARCFCNEGFYGSACEKVGTGRAVLGNTSKLLLCVCVFLLLIEVGVLFMWKRVKGLRLDPAAYANLNKENMGMISNMA